MDVEICKTRIMQTCPNCRYTYHDDLHSTCPSCYQNETLNCSMPVVVSSKRHHLPSSCSNGANCAVSLYDWALSKQEQHRWRKFLCGGSVTCNDDEMFGEPKSDDAQKPSDLTKKLQDGGDNSNISPTASLSFILSPVPLFASRTNNICAKDDQSSADSFYNSEEDLHRIAKSQRLLKMSGWYHRGLSWKGAIELLMPTPVGTFLIRDSSDSKYLYSLSVQTKCGPTSIRIHYSNGDFRLDADHNVAKLMPKYPCIIKLIQSYIESTKNLPLKCSHENENPAWQNVVGKIYSQVVLAKPMNTKDHFPSLKHLSRLCINQNLLDPSFRNVLAVPAYVIYYLNEYPYKY